MGKWENGQMGKWENGKTGKWENGKTGKRKNAKMGVWRAEQHQILIMAKPGIRKTGNEDVHYETGAPVQVVSLAVVILLRAILNYSAGNS